MGDLVQDLSLGAGLGLLTLNRTAGINGVSYGGVAVVGKESFGKLERIHFKNPEKYKVLVAAVSLKGHRRKLVLIACYLLPGYTRQRGVAALDYIEERLVELKRRYKDPYLIVAGDFNHWRVEDSLANFGDMKEVEVGNTRGNSNRQVFYQHVQVCSGVRNSLSFGD